MDSDLELSFARANSPVYKRVVQACASFSGFRTEDGYHVLPLTIGEVMLQWEAFCFVFEKAEKWVTFSFKVKGRPLIKNGDHRKAYRALAEVRECLYNQQDSLLPAEYCSKPGWGCLLLRSVGYKLDFWGSGQWYAHGNLVDGRWVIDKDRIRTMLLNEARGKMAHKCPAFDEARVLRAVDALPDFIDTTQKCWELLTVERMVEGRIVSVPYSVRWVGVPDMDKEINMEMLLRMSTLDVSQLPADEIDRLIKKYFSDEGS